MFSPSLSNQWPHSPCQIVGWEKIKSYTSANQSTSASLRGLTSLSIIQLRCEAQPVKMMWAGHCIEGGHLVKTNLMLLIHINAGGSKGHLQMLYWYWIKAGCCVLSEVCGRQSFTLAVWFWPEYVQVCCIFWEWAHLLRTAKFRLVWSRNSSSSSSFSSTLCISERQEASHTTIGLAVVILKTFDLWSKWKVKQLQHRNNNHCSSPTELCTLRRSWLKTSSSTQNCQPSIWSQNTWIRNKAKLTVSSFILHTCSIESLIEKNSSKYLKCQ